MPGQEGPPQSPISPPWLLQPGCPLSELAQRACLVKRGLLNPPLARHGSLAYTASGRVGLGLGLVDRASSIPHLAAAPPPMTRHFEETYF